MYKQYFYSLNAVSPRTMSLISKINYLSSPLLVSIFNWIDAVIGLKFRSNWQFRQINLTNESSHVFFIFFFSVYSHETYDGRESVKKWLNEARTHNPNIVVVLCGNKNDLENNQREVDLMAAGIFAQENGK